MPPRTSIDNREPLERLKDLIGFKWYQIFTFLIGLYIPVFGIGYFFGGISARSELKDNSPQQSSNSTNQDLTPVLVGYERLINQGIAEKKQFKDSVEVLSKRVEVYYRIIKSYEDERKAKK